MLTQRKNTVATPILSKNKTAHAIIKQVEKTGCLDGFGEEIRQLGREFREEFELMPKLTSLKIR